MARFQIGAKVVAYIEEIMKEKKIYSINDIPEIAKHLRLLFSTCKVMTFTGSLGAGKTTLIKELLKQSGVIAQVSSPTFTYLNQYEDKEGNRFYHFDLYRLKSIDEFQSAGFDEHLYEPESWALIEWPEHIMPLLKDEVCHITIEYGKDSSKREITVEHN